LKVSEDIKLLTGNEAIARGAYEAGIKVATAYPGTPSTEILENITHYSQIYCQWSINEKVAMEVASGSSIAGARTLAAMKHVGLNVAADPFMTLSYTGVNGGLVIVVADDPYMHSSQNEQDSRFYAKFAKIPLLEPSDSQEAKDLIKDAINISEKFDTPVMLRTTTRISHSRSPVKQGARIEVNLKGYKKDCQKYVMIPAFGRIRHEILLERWNRLCNFSEKSKLNRIYIPQDDDSSKDRGSSNLPKIGVITSGVSYQYSREIFSNVPILKLVISNPLPAEFIKKFCTDKEIILIVEELEPFLEEQVKALGIKAKIIGKDFFPQSGELSLGAVENAYNQLFGTKLLSSSNLQNENARGIKSSKKNTSMVSNYSIPGRPPVLCAGCPHRSVFYILKKLRVTVMGDIGCYTLSVLPPLSSLDSCLCMGAGVGQALGMEKANPKLKGKIVSVIGDSTFFHSGITSLIDNLYNKGSGVIIILDNRTTAMTGHQVHPGVGKTLMGEETVALKPEKLAEAAGVKNVKVVDPYDLKYLEKVFKEELEKRQLSVIICRQKCVLLEKTQVKRRVTINLSKCEKCGLCLKFGCPAIECKNDQYSINELLCTGCGVCASICKKGAIELAEK
jgi:indolepyruvate ferredoxin oxidoreductase alpha subunit